ncbi:lipid-A-disaccharide synthase [Roseibium sp. TrichSKD4]|uniref:lipid-A-disaccharide synthase n=1 Tax=Roseibium sp. TrichSKD4 TaxID=744980 RepID=UPI0001E56738|nr:lipid-A-disaccharide synthase [Roseibium sp. TrichSKD4]EFO33651.1 lipid-A-disaccharide synthase [Roseibium sp. TrichSKD4]
MIDKTRKLTVAIVAGEESGDALGAELISALNSQLSQTPDYIGTGGERMAALGHKSLFPISDVAVMGLTAVLARLPLIIKRVHQTVDAIVQAQPDVLVIIDSPDFTHNIAKRVRKKAPNIPIVGYVSPSVWAWRSGRAKRMSVYVDDLLALLPFEPDVHKRLGGPPTHYVGHPLSENVTKLRPSEGERTPLEEDKRVLLVLPGSRSSEVGRLLETFGQTVEKIAAEYPDLEILLPAVSHLESRIRSEVAVWPVQPTIVVGQEAKQGAFRRAHAALAASGTVSLEVALSGVPMVVAYKLDWFYRRVKELNNLLKFSGVNSMVLPNIILEENIIPEFLDDNANPDALCQKVLPLLADSPDRDRQTRAFEKLDDIMRLPDGASQSGAAAEVVLRRIGSSKIVHMDPAENS